jgi:iron complex outermembrane receptor protein
LFDNRVRVNVGAYYSDYEKRLTGINGFECLGEAPPKTRRDLASQCPPGGSITWGGYITRPATLKGIEFEVSARLFDDLLLNLNAGYNEYDSGVDTIGEPGYLFAGNLIQPRSNMSVGAQYSIRFGAGTLTPRLDWVYQSKQTFNSRSSSAAPLPEDIIGSTSILNARLTYEPTDSKWLVDLAITNMADEFYPYAQFSGSGFATAATIAPPRQALLSLRRSF